MDKCLVKVTKICTGHLCSFGVLLDLIALFCYGYNNTSHPSTEIQKDSFYTSFN